jgi:hypothetical protein
MSIKDLFDKGQSLKFLKNKSKNDLAKSVESYRYVDVYNQRKDSFRPDVDFATASNFARFGLAEEYYDAAIKRIYETYPYDGSQTEKIEWENQSTYLDLFVFENEYPRTNGYVVMGTVSSFDGSKDANNNVYISTSPEYIFLKGGPNADPDGDYKSDHVAGPSGKGVSKANIYDTSYQRTNNLELDLAKGVTVEFWLKKDGWASTSEAHHEYVFHSWNSGSSPSSGSLRAYVYGETADSKGIMHLAIVSGSTELSFDHDTGISDIADSKWHHYALTAKTKGADTLSNLYVDGVHKSGKLIASSTLNAVTGTMIAAIGGLVGPLSGSSTIGKGWGNIVSSSFDEFRYWKTERDSEQIGRFYIDHVGGGTNTDNDKHDDIDNKVSLGVYYKFNEGITGRTSTDATILDYSGRISNGTFVNYSASSRNTGSAIVSSSAATKEFLDPIIYSHHPSVEALISDKKTSGSMHDHENASSLYKSMPAWIAEQDEEQSKNLKYLTQIMASFFDDLYLQIEKLPRLKDINYPDDNNYEKPLPFAERLLSSRGYDAPELFADVAELGKYLDRDEKKLFEKKLYEVKNIIYQNIYNNLSYIQKSKGTFKSLRNFLRCFGVDEELIKLNVYSNNDTYKLKDNTTNTSVKKSYIDFDDIETRLSSSGGIAGSYSATAYQYYDSTDSNSLSYIPGATESLLTGAMMTVETEVIFPRRHMPEDKNYKNFPSVTSSIFGLHAVTASNTDLTFASSNTIDFNVHVAKTDDDLRNVKFILSGSNVFTPIETTGSYAGVYDNEKWNLAFRLRPTKAPTNTAPALNTSTGFLLPTASAYTYELYGVNYVSNILQNEFTISGTMSLANALTFFKEPKRVFLGAERTNFTGSVRKYSDVKVSSTRVWLDYLTNETIQAHARDASSYGAFQPYRNSNDSLNSNFVPQISTLILNWTMDNLTGSNASGQFLIEDFASGSTDQKLKFGDYWASPISKYNYSGRGDKFSTDANLLNQAIDIEFVQSAKLKLPEVVNSDDMIKTLNQQDEMVFTRDTNYIEHFLSVEKSMYQTISEEMLRFFATVNNFNNLIGEPVNRYRPYYKKMQKLRELFFESVENERLELEKFIEYFKWIDDAVTIMIAQLIPLSSNNTEFLRNMVESHVLERNKYWTKFPTLETKTKDPLGSLRGIEELRYNWKFGHAPVSPSENSNQNTNCLWWKERAERDGPLTSGVSSIDSNKNEILKIAITEQSGSEPRLTTTTSTRYLKSYYADRSLSRVADLTIEKAQDLRGGSTQADNNLHDFYKGVIRWGSDDDFIYLDIDNETKETDCDDAPTPPELDKKKLRIRALTMTEAETLESTADGTKKNDLKYTDAKSSLILPFQIFTSSLDTGYQKLYSDQFKIDFTNIHEDKYGFNSATPLQGPFTEKHVGGQQHRHIKLNQGSDDALTRAEGWHLKEFLFDGTQSTILNEGFNNATSTGTDNIRILSLPIGSAEGDPSPAEYWRNGVGTDNSWTFLSGSSPTVGTGPTKDQRDAGTGGYAYCEVLPSRVGQTFGLATPLIDLLDLYESSTDVTLEFYYHMFGINMGNLKVQASTDKNFTTDVTDLLVRWDAGGTPFESTIISGQQQASAGAAWRLARITSAETAALQEYIGKRFYIRLLYTAGITQLGDCAIDSFTLKIATSGDISRNSFKVFHPTFDDHNRPYATLTRGLLAKRPVNIRNIETTGSSPTQAGNYFDRYEYVSTVSPEVNDPYFVKNNSQITKTTFKRQDGSIQLALSRPPGPVVDPFSVSEPIYTLPDRSYLTGSVRNRTRIMTRFSSPGGFETLSRGYLDPAHETYAVGNALTYRNPWPRKVHNSQLQAHCGRFGVSAHDATTARVYGNEVVGRIRSEDFDLVGQAAAHKTHRNNIERLELSGSVTSPTDFVGMTVITASVYDNRFISHMVPRTDQQTRWITGSII